LALSSKAEDKFLRFRQLTVKDGLPQNGTLGVAQDKYGFMWFGTWNGLCRYDGYEFTTYYNDEDDSTSLVNDRILGVFKDSIGDIWVSFANDVRLCRFNYKQNNFSRHHFQSVNKSIVDSLNRYKPFVKSVAQTKDYKWVVEYPFNRLEQINKNTQHKITYHPDPLNKWAISSETVGELFLDDNNVLWVPTMGSGINYADTQQKNFKLYRSASFSNNIRSICKDHEGNMWVGTRNNGIGLINEQRNTIIHFPMEENETYGENTFTQIRQLYCDRYGYIWIGTKAGLRKYNPKNKTFKDYTIYTESSIPHNWIFEIMEDHKGNLWIGTFRGFARYNREDDQFRFYDPRFYLASLKVRAIAEDKAYNLWVATEEGGLTCLKRDSIELYNEQNTPKHYIHDTNDSCSISSNNIYSMDFDEKGQIWLATSNGLNVFNPDNGCFTSLSVNEGIPERMIMAVLCDQNGYAWISHMKGLSRININTLAVTSYTDYDGLQDRDYLENACFRDTLTGELYFGGTNGLNVFNPGEINDNTSAPKVYITALHILNYRIGVNQTFNGRVILTRPVYLTEKIVLEHQDRTISLDFAGLHYSSPQGNRFKYKLEGFDDEWIYTDADKRTASYSNLSAGKYTFKVFASNSDRVWNEQPAELSIEVLPPWWLSSWAYLGYFLLIILLIYVIVGIITARDRYRHQIEFEKLKAEKLKEFDNLKSRFFSNMAHELRTPLSLIIDPLEKVISDSSFTAATKNYFLTMKRNANRLYKLTNQLLDFRKMETGSLELLRSVNDMVKQVRSIHSSFESQALHRHINYTFTTYEESLSFAYDYNKIETVLYNLISNAFKYTPDNGMIAIKLSVVEKQTNQNDLKQFLEIEITDSGKGIKQSSINHIFEMFYKEPDVLQPTDKSYGIGLAFTKELVDLHDGTITVDSVLGSGTCFKVHLPYMKVIADNNDQLTKNIEVQGHIETYSLEFSSERQTESKNKTVILLVEDNMEIRNYLLQELSINYKVYTATNGQEGLDRAVEYLPDLIISDIMMPGMDGIELCKRLNSDVKTSHIPIILLTARQSEESIIEGYQTGADAYIIKPFSTVVLNSRIQNLLASRIKLRELFGKGTFIDTKAITNNVIDEAFINKAIKIIQDNLSETEFNSETLSEKLKMSRALLYKKIKSITDMTVHNFILTVKMNKASEFLLSGEFNVSEVAYKVGFTDASNFSRSFSKQFGCSPSKYIAEHSTGG